MVAKLLTLIAQKAASTTSIADPVEVQALESVRAHLKTLASPSHVVEEISSLADVRTKLKTASLGTGDTLQIVGHGMPGLLALDFFWSGVSHDAKGVYVVDSNLYLHQVLDGAIAAGVDVRIVGCSVGADRTYAGEFDGPTLLFDLARLWSCRVEAPVDLVGPEHFGSDGHLRTDPAQGGVPIVVAHGRAVSTSNAPSPLTPTSREEELAPIATVTRVNGRVVDTAGARVRQELARPLRMALVVARAAPRPLALPQLQGTLADGRRFAILHQGAIVRVADGDEVVYGVLAPESRDAVREALRAAR